MAAKEQEVSLSTGHRTHTCGQLRIGNVGEQVTLSGWVQTARNMNAFFFVDLRDRYGITQCVIPNPANEEGASEANFTTACSLGRECVVKVTGTVVERINKNANRPTGDIEIKVSEIALLNSSKTPPFLIEDQTDGLEDIRLKYRYLDIRRNPMREALVMRHKCTQIVRNYLSNLNFVEVETPVLIKSTPEGARDFVVPSRMNAGTFYALPQSPQTFKQILMVGGLDRYFQIVKCFRDEELRADRQPEFTQIDCEMSYVEQEDVLNTFESLIRKLFKDIVGHEFPPFRRMQFDDAMRDYGIDKPDLRFDMKFFDITSIAKNKDFKLFNEAEATVGIVAAGIADYSKKKMKELESLAKSQMCGGTGLFWVKVDSLEEKKFTTSFNGRFYDAEDFASWCAVAEAKTSDTLLIMSGEELKSWKTRQALGKFRHEFGTKMGLRDSGYEGLWVVDFPMLEYDEDAKRWNAMHHPFTSPKPDDLQYIETDPGRMRANAYDMVINGMEVGGGSIRIHDQKLQSQVFTLLGMSAETAQEQFGFLLGAFEYGAPPHGGLAFGLDRLCTILGGFASIRDVIAFPKNKAGRDLMISSPSLLAPEQMEELKIATTATEDDLKKAATMWNEPDPVVSKKAKKAKRNKGDRHPGGHGHGHGHGQKQAEAPAAAEAATPAAE